MKTRMRTHIGPHRCWEALILAYLIFGFSVQHIQAQTDSSCSKERSSRSAKTTQAVNATFTNQTEELHTVYWLDFDGKRQKWFDLSAGQALQQSTFAGHLWLVAKPNGQCVAIFSAPGNFVVGKAQVPINTNRPQQPQRQKTVQPASNAATCPTVRVSSPTEVDEGQPITFTASVAGGDRDLTVTYNWVLTAGTISSGQGTSTITVDTTRPHAASVTATVQIGGVDRICNNRATSTTGLIPPPPPARKFDEFGTLKTADLHSHLDNYAIRLQSEPGAQGYVITYGGRTSTTTAAKTAGEKVKKYLGDVRGIDYSRIVLVDGGYREKPFTELWILPYKGSKPPTATPTVKPPKKTTKKTTTKK